MPSSTPLEILVGPLELYVAPVGEAMPAVDAAPSGNWELVGTSGSKNYAEDGVTISHPQVFSKIRVVGSTGPVKAVRTEEDLIIAVTLYDFTMEEYTRALGNAAVTEVAAGSGTVGTRALTLRRGESVAEFALLCRGETSSPELVSNPAQYEVPRVYVDGNPTEVFNKSDAAGYLMEFHALEDPAASTAAERFGEFKYVDEAALP